MDAESKRLLVYSYGVESSKDMSALQLADACDKVQGTRTTLDLLRKRLIAAIGSWLKMTGQESHIDYIKAVACRSAKRDSFNTIPREQLNNLYHAYTKKQKDWKSVERFTSDKIDEMVYKN